MSLATRVLNLFNADPSSTLEQPAKSPIVSNHDGYAAQSMGFASDMGEERTHDIQETRAEVELEMKRPPYLHVRASFTIGGTVD